MIISPPTSLPRESCAQVTPVSHLAEAGWAHDHREVAGLGRQVEVLAEPGKLVIVVLTVCFFRRFIAVPK